MNEFMNLPRVPVLAELRRLTDNPLKPDGESVERAHGRTYRVKRNSDSQRRGAINFVTALCDKFEKLPA